MKILALIPARGGSKRLPGKNIRLLGGKPLIAWTIESAQRSQVTCDILVSTDDSSIAEVAAKLGAMVPWLRPAELATDTATSMDVVLHAMDWYETNHGVIDGLILLQPTSPFRKAETICQAAEIFATNGLRPVVSMSPACVHPAWCFQVERDSLTPVFGWDAIKSCSQDLPVIYTLNGAIYLAAPKFLRQYQTFLTADTWPMIINSLMEALDIDTDWDWWLAESAATSGIA